MHPKRLMEKLCKCLDSCVIIPKTIRVPILAEGKDMEILGLNLNKEQANKSGVDNAGIYIIGNHEDVLKIGEAGKKRGMANRIFRQMNEDWMNKATMVFFVTINPGEFSRLGEQMALALYFNEHKRLPMCNRDWK